MIEKYKSYKFSEILEVLSNLYLTGGDKAINDYNNSWCVYSKTSEITLDSICYINDYADIDDDTDEEIYPLFVIENNLEIVSRDEMLQDVVSSALYQKRDASNDDLLKAFNFYRKKDSFIEF